MEGHHCAPNDIELSGNGGTGKTPARGAPPGLPLNTTGKSTSRFPLQRVVGRKRRVLAYYLCVFITDSLLCFEKNRNNTGFLDNPILGDLQLLSCITLPFCGFEVQTCRPPAPLEPLEGVFGKPIYGNVLLDSCRDSLGIRLKTCHAYELSKANCPPNHQSGRGAACQGKTICTMHNRPCLQRGHFRSVSEAGGGTPRCLCSAIAGPGPVLLNERRC